jgi:glutamate racemase
MLQLLKDVDKLSNNAPIGVFDSGLGGLTVWREVRRALPAESLAYLGDGKNCPYGSRPREEVRRLADEAVAFLVAQGCKLVVVACNTATAAAIDFLREKYAPMPIVGMEPAVKPACLATRSGVVGVLATERSLDGELFRRTAARYGDGVDLVTAPGRGFVELVENDLEATPEAEATVRAAVAEMLEHGADQIVLGCTHYPFLLPVLERVVAGRGVTVVDPSPAVARRVVQLLDRYGLHVDPAHRAEYTFRTFADEAYRLRLERKALGAL